MKQYNFRNFSDEELLKMEQKVDSELSEVLVQMRYNEELEKMFEELEAIKEEKRRRKVNG